MGVSQAPPHIADRHLEVAQDLARLVRIITETAEQDDWNDARQGLLRLSRQIEQKLADAREAIDAV
ncbi:hypothetical protein FIV06_15615 [Labrenzia sp. THAF191b]|uniref:hypothetical protein n=1 Tax=unclassified Labrenzia TaxID=2648686 RepID=UPI001268015E|nr:MULTISPECIES: hypothetical protein [unclassified Labrenzia]QFS98855.1 hypothetical protein FIV06_15615 [Labrenzia sp. THAF191b]QFT05169.1 hypothetical protein FIV05_15610 [Labrenzia sp. THAF191a]QFT16713.1 hypothetical protein FIV03_15625 [Labrenzia sp. THAF187b]